MRSKLVLARESASGAKDGQAGGTLEPWEVYQMELPLTRLVVLSGCQTGIERQYNGEGPISFARAFIAAGVPLMVASLWTVDSDASAELMISFHRYRKRDSLPTAEALRRAQLDMLESQDPRYHRPYYWASFITIGGYAEF
jgi:CHAT domain-containing protein